MKHIKLLPRWDGSSALFPSRRARMTAELRMLFRWPGILIWLGATVGIMISFPLAYWLLGPFLPIPPTPLTIYLVCLTALAAVIAVVFVQGIRFAMRPWFQKALRRELNRAGVRTCIACGYDLRRIDSTNCPECGEDSQSQKSDLAR